MASGTDDAADPIHLAGAPIVQTPDCELPARELARYLYLLTGRESALVDRLPERGTMIVLHQELARQLAGAAKTSEIDHDGFATRAIRGRDTNVVTILADSARGLHNGVYALLEELGVGFYLGGDTFPDAQTDAVLPADFGLTQQPAFAVRGNLLHDNALVGITTWGLADYQFHLHQLAKQRCNTLVITYYSDGAPELWDEQAPRSAAPGPLMSTLTKSWHALRPMRTGEFHFGTGDCFDEDIFACPAAQTLDDPIAQRREAIRVFQEATRYARRLGIDIAAGFWVPFGGFDNPTDPTDPEVQEHFRQRIRRYLARYPHLTYFVLQNHESGGCSGTAPPRQAGAARKLFDSMRDQFAYLGNPRRVWEAIRFLRFAELAHDVVQEVAPQMKLVLSGWGGDRWMRLADYYVQYDKLLPDDVIFTCHDNIDASMGLTVSEAWGQLSSTRQHWAVPWMENDNSDFWSPQPGVEHLHHLAADALGKGCQGLLTMHWRTRDMEEEAGYAARFAWNPQLTPERFCHELARDAFGVDHDQAMAEHLLTLQRLGTRWTGVKGTPEIAPMVFAGWKPHAPFELGREAVEWLRPYARDARRHLAETAAHDGAYDGELIHQVGLTDEVTTENEDVSQLGVTELDTVIQQLDLLADESDSQRLRQALVEVEEQLFAVRPELIRRGMSPAQFRSFDAVVLRVHHLIRNAGVSERMTTLERIRSDLAKRREQLVAADRIGRLERLDYLTANIDFVRHFDRVAMLLAGGEMVERALADAERLAGEGQTAQAAQIATDAYEQLTTAGMRDAALALTRKLTTRDAFAILATVNIKPLAAYFQIIDRLTAFMSAAPASHADDMAIYDTALLPNIIAPQPPGIVEAGQALTVRVVVLSRRSFDCVALHYRPRRDGSWKVLPMKHGFRHSYETCIPAEQIEPGMIEYFVEASDDDGQSTCWPAAARHGRPWTASVLASTT